ncbi:MAG TPA: regulatory protein RecX [Chromatiaceae bacterium]|nr:regulatory protein RecX [Chromatiaceae bacterium]
MTLLANREHSRAELARKLAGRGFDTAAVDEALEQLAETGLLDEGRLAEAYVAERLHKGFGPLRIRHELRGKGLADDLIAPHLRLDDGDWLDLIAAAHDKRFGPALPADAKERARRGRFLEYRGFPGDLIARFLHGVRGD